MTLCLLPNQYITNRKFERKNFSVLFGTQHPFEGGLVTMHRWFRNKKRPIERYQGKLEDILLDKEIPQVTINSLASPMPTGKYYKPTRVELEFLQEINHFIAWAQTHNYHIQIGELSDEEYQRSTEQDFVLASLQIQAL